MKNQNDYSAMIQDIGNFLSLCELNKSTTYEKRDLSPVTVVDLGLQYFILKHLKKMFPEDSFLAEEKPRNLQKDLLNATWSLIKNIEPQLSLENFQNTTQPETALNLPFSHQWFIDPLDGTKGYLRGEQFAIALCRYKGPAPQEALLICPRLPFPSWNSSEIGCVLYWKEGISPLQTSLKYPSNWTPIVKSDPKAPQRPWVRSVEKAHGNFENFEDFMSSLGLSPAWPIDSQVKYALLARGEAFLYCRNPSSESYREKVWDHGAGSALLKACGGSITDIDGQLLDFTQGEELSNNRGILATQSLDHQKIVRKLSEFLRKV